MDYALEQSKKVMTCISSDVIGELCEEFNIAEQEIVSYEEQNNNISTMHIDTKYLNNFLKAATQKTLLKIKAINTNFPKTYKD